VFEMIGSVFSLGFAAVVVIPVWRIFQRAGLQPAWSLTLFLPFIGPLVTLAIVAFSTWGPTATYLVIDEARYDPRSRS
jgi:hypothetical protein